MSITIICIILFGFLYKNFSKKSEVLVYKPTEVENTIEAGGGSQEQDEAKSKKQITVYICGEVKNPNVYQLEAGSRLIDIIKLAGGLTDKADQDVINLAEYIEDAEKIEIPKIVVPVESNTEIPKVESTIVESKMQPKLQEKFTEPATETITSSKQAIKNNVVEKSAKINLNKATQTELDALPGIGPTIATAIIEYREQHGGFKSIEDIKNVKRIGDKTFDKIKGLITVN